MGHLPAVRVSAVLALLGAAQLSGCASPAPDKSATTAKTPDSTAKPQPMPVTADQGGCGGVTAAGSCFGNTLKACDTSTTPPKLKAEVDCSKDCVAGKCTICLPML